MDGETEVVTEVVEPSKEAETPTAEPAITVEPGDSATQEQRTKEQLAALTRAHQEAVKELKQLREQGLEVKELVDGFKTLQVILEDSRNEQVGMQISNLVAGGEDETARIIAERDVKVRLKRLGVDPSVVPTDPDLKALNVDDPIKARANLDILEPVLRRRSKPEPPKEEPPKESPKELPKEEPAKEKKDLRITTQTSSGGDDFRSLSPEEKIKRGLAEREK